jgi:hypothetical protein
VDEAFEAAFERASGKRYGGNSHYSLCLTPADSTYIRNYSDARSTLTGIITSHDTLKSVSAHLLWSLIWVIQQRVADENAAPLPADWRQSYTNPQSKAPPKFPIQWYKTVVEKFGEASKKTRQASSATVSGGSGRGGGGGGGGCILPRYSGDSLGEDVRHRHNTVSGGGRGGTVLSFNRNCTR